MKVFAKLVLVLAVSSISQLAMANSVRVNCEIPGGVFFGESSMLETYSSGGEDKVISILERNGDNEETIGSLSDLIADFYGKFESGDAVSVSSTDKLRNYSIKIVGEGQELGTWNSNSLMSEPAKSCSASSDFSASSYVIEVTRTENGSSQTVKSQLVCTSQGGYHGYWGQSGCPIDGEEK